MLIQIFGGNLKFKFKYSLLNYDKKQIYYFEKSVGLKIKMPVFHIFFP